MGHERWPISISEPARVRPNKASIQPNVGWMADALLSNKKSGSQGLVLRKTRRFFPQQRPSTPPVRIAPTHEGMARLSGPEWPGNYRDGRDSQEVVTNPSANRARCSLTSLTWRTPLTLRQTTSSKSGSGDYNHYWWTLAHVVHWLKLSISFDFCLGNSVSG